MDDSKSNPNNFVRIIKLALWWNQECDEVVKDRKNSCREFLNNSSAETANKYKDKVKMSSRVIRGV